MSEMPVLAFDRVARSHWVGREHTAVLEDVTVEVWPGELAAGIEAPDDGVVRLDGEALDALSASSRTRRLRTVGFAPKTWRVARGKPVLDHVALPLLAEGRPLVT